MARLRMPFLKCKYRSASLTIRKKVIPVTILEAFLRT